MSCFVYFNFKKLYRKLWIFRLIKTIWFRLHSSLRSFESSRTQFELVHVSFTHWNNYFNALIEIQNHLLLFPFSLFFSNEIINYRSTVGKTWRRILWSSDNVFFNWKICKNVYKFSVKDFYPSNLEFSVFKYKIWEKIATKIEFQSLNHILQGALHAIIVLKLNFFVRKTSEGNKRFVCWAQTYTTSQENKFLTQSVNLTHTLSISLQMFASYQTILALSLSSAIYMKIGWHITSFCFD